MDSLEGDRQAQTVERWDQDVGRIHNESFADVVRFVYLIVQSKAVAEEVAQEAFIRLFQHRNRVQNPVGFLRTTATRTALSWRLRAKGEVNRLAAIGEQRPAGPPGEPDELWDRVARLSPKLRAVIVLRFYLDLPHDEIAATLGCRPATARTRLHRALAALKEDIG